MAAISQDGRDVSARNSDRNGHYFISITKASNGRAEFSWGFPQRAKNGVMIVQPLRYREGAQGAGVNDHRAFAHGVTIGQSQAKWRRVNLSAGSVLVSIVSTDQDAPAVILGVEPAGNDSCRTGSTFRGRSGWEWLHLSGYFLGIGRRW